MTRRLGPWLIAAGVAGAALAALLTSPSAPAPIGRGSQAPAFTLERLGGGGSVALADLHGKVVLLNFWATWCKPCEEEMPAMERLYRELQGEDFELLGVSVDDDPDDVAEFRSLVGVTFPILLDSHQEVSRAYQTFRYPETLLIDQRGVVVERFIGPKEWDAAPYLARIRQLLDERAS